MEQGEAHGEEEDVKAAAEGSIVSAGRSTLYRQYYAKIEGLTEMVLMDMLSKSFRSIKEIAKKNGPLSQLFKLPICVIFQDN